MFSMNRVLLVSVLLGACVASQPQSPRPRAMAITIDDLPYVHGAVQGSLEAVPQTLLIHANDINSDCLDTLLDRFEARGYRFITLDESMADPAYRTRDTYVGTHGPSWLFRWIKTLGQNVSFKGDPEPPAWVTALTSTAVWPQPPNSSKADLALVGGTIYVSPTEEPIKNGVVLIQGGKISAVGSMARLRVPQTAQALDCSGLTITAGFWNSHAHFFERKWENAAAIPAPELSRQLQDMLTRYGFTSVFDVGSMWENTRRLRDRIESGEVPGPRIRSTGEALVAPGAIPPAPIIRVLGYMTSPSPEITDAEQATAASKKLLDAGVDGIKVHLQPPSPPNPPIPENAIQAAVNEAHRAGKPAFVHPNDRADVLAAVRAGVDVIAHTTPRSPWDETVLAAMKERRVALTPTLTVWNYLLRHDRISAQEQSVNASIAQLRAWVASGGTVLFGNDLGAAEYDPSEEYTLMAAAGMSFLQILASLTTAPAELFGESKQAGRIATGLKADLVILKGDPSRNIRALTAVQYTLRSGKIIFRAGA